MIINKYHVNKGDKNGESYIVKSFTLESKAKKYIQEQEAIDNKHIYFIDCETFELNRIMNIYNSMVQFVTDHCQLSVIAFYAFLFLVVFLAYRTVILYLMYKRG